MSASRDDAHADAHTPVLYQRVLEAVQPEASGRYIDGTLGAGGHAYGILEASSPDGELLGIDRDRAALAIAEKRLQPFRRRLHLRQGTYAEMQEHAAAIGWHAVDGVLLDLGLSSMQLEDPGRGFSFRSEGPLDMRFDQEQPRHAGQLVNELPEEDLADLLHRYGEERRARRIARAIVRARPIQSTLELAEVVRHAVRRGGGRIHPATKTFQALRIAVNEELEQLEQGLFQAVDLLHPGGRLAVIAFHSLEDRIVKHTLRRESRDCICPPEQPVCTCDHAARLRLITRRPLRPDEGEIQSNPRARSARLRVAERLSMA